VPAANTTRRDRGHGTLTRLNGSSTNLHDKVAATTATGRINTRSTVGEIPVFKNLPKL
jgi:hypothetical protein